MSEVLQCDLCKKITTPIAAIGWVKVSPVADTIVSLAMPREPSHYCSCTCLVAANTDRTAVPK